MINPIVGVLYHWLGGVAAGSFYVPYKGVKRWSWETYWLVGGVFSWILCPGAFALLLTEDLLGVIGRQTAGTLISTYLFGVLWGIGGLTFGLTIRYLGISLGVGVALGFCAAFGTLLPPILKSFISTVPVPETIGQILASAPGRITLAGIVVCLLGIGIAALAGLTKEREMSVKEKSGTIAEFNFRKGVLLAVFSGIMSACFAFALTAGHPIGEASIAAGTHPLWSGLPKLVVVLLGGFTTNFAWCMFLNVRHGTGYQFLARNARPEHAGLIAASGEPATTMQAHHGVADLRIPRAGNYFFSALAGITWYFQFFFYTMGETQMGDFGFASWTLHMASIIVVSTVWGWIFKEWKGASRKAHAYLVLGIGTLVLSTVIIGIGTFLKSSGSTPSLGAAKNERLWEDNFSQAQVGGAWSLPLSPFGLADGVLHGWQGRGMLHALMPRFTGPTLVSTGDQNRKRIPRGGYLTEYMPASVRSLLALPLGTASLTSPAQPPSPTGAPDATVALDSNEGGEEDSSFYYARVAPALERTCVSCHNPNKVRGGLRLDTLVHLMEGGDSGDSIVPGKLTDSELYRRITLPHDDEEFMPSDGKKPLSPVETKWIELWIAAGASETAPLSDFSDAPPPPLLAGAGMPAWAPDYRSKLDVADALAKKLGIRVVARSQRPTDGLIVRTASSPANCTDETLGALSLLSEVIVDAELARTQITDTGLAALSGWKNLRRLDLTATAITVEGLRSILELEKLEFLNLTDTPTDWTKLPPELTQRAGLKIYGISGSKD